MLGHNQGTTSDEVEQITNLPHTTVSARRTEFRKAGLTDYLYDEHGDPIQRLTRQGRGAAVEVATLLGKETIRLGWPININGKDDPTAGRHGGNPMSAAAFRSTNFASARREVLRVMCLYSP